MEYVPDAVRLAEAPKQGKKFFEDLEKISSQVFARGFSLPLDILFLIRLSYITPDQIAWTIYVTIIIIISDTCSALKLSELKLKF